MNRSGGPSPLKPWYSKTGNGMKGRRMVTRSNPPPGAPMKTLRCLGRQRHAVLLLYALHRVRHRTISFKLETVSVPYRKSQRVESQRVDESKNGSVAK